MLQPPGSSSRSKAYSSNRRKTQESSTDKLRKLSKNPGNKKCADCQSKLPQCINLSVGSFVCMSCAGIHRELNNKVKSLGHSEFTDDEVEMMKQTDNDKVNALWLARYNPSQDRMKPPQSNDDQTRLRAWIRRKYVDKQWYGGGGGTVIQQRRAPPAGPGGGGGGRGSHPQPTMVQIPPATKEPEQDLLTAFDAPTPAPSGPSPAPPPQNKVNDSWANFGGSSQQQQQNFADFGGGNNNIGGTKSDPFATHQGSAGFANFNNQGGQPQQQLQQPPQRQNFGNFGNAGTDPFAQQVPAPSQNNFGNFNQQLQQQDPFAQQGAPPPSAQNNFGNFNQQPQQQQQQQQQQDPFPQPQKASIASQSNFANFNQQPQQQTQQPIPPQPPSQQQMQQTQQPIAQTNNNFGNFKNQGSQLQQNLPGNQNFAGGNASQMQMQPPQMNLTNPQVLPQSQQMSQQMNSPHAMAANFQGQQSNQQINQQPSLQDPFANMHPEPQLQPTQVQNNGQNNMSMGVTQSTTGANNYVQDQPVVNMGPGQGRQTGGPQQQFSQINEDTQPASQPATDASVMSGGKKEDPTDAFAHLSFNDNQNNVLASSGTPFMPKAQKEIKYFADQFVCYKTNGDKIKAKIVKVHLDDKLQPYYTIMLPFGKEKQTDDAHLSVLDPVFEEIELKLLSLSSAQLKEVEAYIANLTSSNNAETPVSMRNTPPHVPSKVEEPAEKVDQVPSAVQPNSPSGMSHVSQLTQPPPTQLQMPNLSSTNGFGGAKMVNGGIQNLSSIPSPQATEKVSAPSMMNHHISAPAVNSGMSAPQQNIAVQQTNSGMSAMPPNSGIQQLNPGMAAPQQMLQQPALMQSSKGSAANDNFIPSPPGKTSSEQGETSIRMSQAQGQIATPPFGQQPGQMSQMVNMNQPPNSTGHANLNYNQHPMGQAQNPSQQQPQMGQTPNVNQHHAVLQSQQPMGQMMNSQQPQPQQQMGQMTNQNLQNPQQQMGHANQQQPQMMAQVQGQGQMNQIPQSPQGNPFDMY